MRRPYQPGSPKRVLPSANSVAWAPNTTRLRSISGPTDTGDSSSSYSTGSSSDTRSPGARPGASVAAITFNFITMGQDGPPAGSAVDVIAGLVITMIHK